MLLVDLLALRLIRRCKGFFAWCAVMVVAGIATLVLAGLIGGYFEDHFGFFRLWAYGIFLHNVSLVMVTAWFWRHTHRRLACGLLAAAACLLLIAVDAFLVEPHWLEVSHWRIASPKIRQPLRIVVVADLQTNRIGPYERDVLRRTLAEKPDVILLAGDYLQTTKSNYPVLRNELNAFLREIHFTAPQGVYAVGGNVDGAEWPKIFEGLDIATTINNRTFNLGDVQLTCLGLWKSFDRNSHVPNDPEGRFHVVLGHAPNFALGDVHADLLLAGHTHGGQVRLPMIGPMITHSQIPNAWAAGMTELPGGGQLLVSRGIGMERGHAPPMRFLCRPELVVIDLVPAS